MKWMRPCAALRVGAVFALVALVGHAAAGSAHSAFAERTIHARALGIAAPEGIVYSPNTGSLVVIGGVGPRGVASGLEISLLADPLGAAMPLPIVDPLNATLDPGGSQLLWLDVAQATVAVTSLSDPASAATSASSAGWRLIDAAGLALDSASGRLFILDPVARQLVVVDPQGDVSLDAARAYAEGQVFRIDLDLPGPDLRGLALHPGDQTLHVLSAAEAALYVVDLQGNLVESVDMSELNLQQPGAMVFAPSANPTDDDSVQHLYIADAGTEVAAAGAAPQDGAAVLEVAVEGAVAQAAAASVAAILVNTIEAFNFDPPSPDSAGITYLTNSNTLLISDSEVNEMPLYQGANLFESTRGGTLLQTSNTLDFSNEPTGVSYDPVEGVLYVSDDNARDIFEVEAGRDGIFGTNDDTVTSLFNTPDFGSSDPEGVAYDWVHGQLFVIDGAGGEVYRVRRGSNGVFDGPPPAGDDVVAGFDIDRHGAIDPEGIAYDEVNDTLVIADRRLDAILEIDTDGNLVRTIDTSVISSAKPSGIVIAPGSLNPAERNFYISDRGVDNNSDPSENDGVVYELSIGAVSGNTPPIVSAGPDQSVEFPQDATLSGSASDDGLPDPPGVLVTSWSQVSGTPGVQFANASSPSTTASFPDVGTYVLRLTANDGEEVRSDDVTVTVNPPPNQPPSADAGADQSLLLPTLTATLQGSASDDGLPDPPGTFSTLWTQVSGPSGVAFGDDTSPTTTATFPGVGSYVLRLTANDSELATSDDVAITVSSVGNSPPSVDAGPDQSLPEGTTSTTLAGSVIDDGNPVPPGSTQISWSQVGGSGVSFADASDPTTQVTLPGPGSFTLRLSGFDGEFTVTDDVVITVAGSGGTYEMRIASSSDDAEERATGGLKLTSSDLELVFDKDDQLVGMRFDGVPVPNGAAISKAWIQFQADETGSGPISLSIQGELTPDAAPFLGVNGNISSRTFTSESVSWSPPDWPSVGAAGLEQRTPDISNVIAQIVSDPGWSPGNALVIVVSGTGKRTAESFDGVPAAAPLLHIEWGGGGGPVDQPPMVSAGSPQSLTLPDLVATLSGSASDDGLPNPPGALTTLWTQESGPPGVVFGDDTSPQTTATFPGTGSYVLRLTANDGATAISSDVAINVIDPSVTPIVTESRIAASSDDAEEKPSGAMRLTSGDLELVFDGGDQTVGMRFTGLAIPPGVQITNAWVQFEVDRAGGDDGSLEIRGELDPNAATFVSTTGNISGRTQTSASVPWTPDPWLAKNDAGPAQQTPNLAAVIQEIVSLPSWSTSSPLVVIIQGTGRREAESFDGEAPAAPLLHVEYLTGGS